MFRIGLLLVAMTLLEPSQPSVDEPYLIFKDGFLCATWWYRDADGDGFGDPADSVFSCLQPPGYVDNAADCDDTNALINPGALEIVGNGVDDDCDEATSDTTPPAPCSKQISFSVTALDLAQALDLCQMTTADPPPEDRKWGLISAELREPDGGVPSASRLAQIQSNQAAVLETYGTGGVDPVEGPTMVGLSTGRMRRQGDPGYVNPNPGTSFGHSGFPPAAYLAAHGGSLPSTVGCSGNCPSGSGANDGVNLRLTIRVPTNVTKLSYQTRFFSADYWEYSCTSYNDLHLALLTSAAEGIPEDKNIAFDALGNPLNINNAFIQICQPKGCYTCPLGTGPLQGTGMQLGDTGGGTSWLTVIAPVVPGEIIVLELMIFDVGDDILDSLVLLDGFGWVTD